MNIYLCTKRNVPIHLTFQTKQPDRCRQPSASYRSTRTHSLAPSISARLTKMFLPKMYYEPGPASRIRPGYTYVVRGQDGNPQFRKSTGRYVHFEDDEDCYHPYAYPNQLVPPPTPYEYPGFSHPEALPRDHKRGKTRLKKLLQQLAEIQGRTTPHRQPSVRSSHSRHSGAGSPSRRSCSEASTSSSSSSSSTASEASSDSLGSSSTSSSSSGSYYEPPRRRMSQPYPYHQHHTAVPMMPGGLRNGGRDSGGGEFGWCAMPLAMGGRGTTGGRGRGMRGIREAGFDGCWDEMPMYDAYGAEGVVRTPRF